MAGSWNCRANFDGSLSFESSAREKKTLSALCEIYGGKNPFKASCKRGVIRDQYN
jgi:hypothetical protein